MVEKTRIPETSPEDIRAAIEFTQSNCSFFAAEGLNGGSLTRSVTLPNGVKLRCDYWEYSGKGDIDTSEACVTKQEIEPHVTRMFNEGGEITMITGSSDDTVAVHIFVDEKPESKNAEAEELIDGGRDELSQV